MDRTALRISVAVLMLVAAAAFAAPQPLPEPVVPQMFGVNIHFAGKADDEVTRIADAGFRIVRMDLTWSSVEKTSGTYDFSEYDALVESLAAKNIRPMFILDYANTLYESGRPPHTLEGQTAFSAYAGAAAARYKDKGVIWEIWNEPNLAQFWAPRASAEDYTALVKSASAAIRAADPSAVIVAPAISGFDLTFLSKCLSQGLLKYVDAVTVHPYRTASPESVLDDYNHLRELLADHTNKQVPVISGEWGYTVADVTPERQAQYLVRSFLVNSMVGISYSIWYDWRDDGTSATEREHNFGVIANDSSPKPALSSIRIMSTVLDGCKFVRRLGGNPDEYILLFKGPNGYRIAAWTTGEPREASIPAEGTSQVVGIDGTKTELKAEAGKSSLRLSQSPVFVELVGGDRYTLEEAVDAKAELDTRFRMQDKVLVSIANPTAKPLKGEASIVLTGQQKPYTHKFSIAAGKSESFDWAPVIVWDGTSAVTADASVKFDGYDSPVTRRVDLGTSRRISAKPSCPIDKIMEFRITSPSKDRMSGKLVLTDVKGLRPASTTMKYAVESQTVVTLSLLDPAPKRFSFGYELQDAVGKVVFKAPVRDYTIVEDFASATMSAPPDAYDFAAAGDEGVEASADAYCLQQETQYTAVKQIPTCRVRYESASGSRTFKLTPKAETALPENPLEVGFWFKGDGRGNTATCTFADSTGQVFQPNGFKMDTTNWRYRTLPLDGSDSNFRGGAADGVPHGLLKWDALFLVDPQGAAAQGTAYIGSVMVVSEHKAVAADTTPEKKPEPEKKKKKKFILF